MGNTGTIGLKMLAVLLLGVVAAGCRCESRMVARDIVVTVDESLKSDGKFLGVQVDVIAVNKGELPAWQDAVIRDYWKTDSSLSMTPDKRAMTAFEETGNVATKTLGKGDAIWNKWRDKGSTDLVIIANIPAYTNVSSGKADPRRVVLPLGCCWWDTPLAPIQVRVSKAGVIFTPQPLPAERKNGSCGD